MRTANGSKINTFYYVGINDSWISNNSSINLEISLGYSSVKKLKNK